MKRKTIITIFVVVLFLVSCQSVDYVQLKSDFDNLLIAGDYDAANALYEAAEDERITYYQNSLDSFSDSLIESTSSYISFDEAKQTLEKFLVFEYTRGKIQSALDNIDAQEQLIAESNAAFVEGMYLYEARDYDAAYQKLSSVDAADENYHIAQNMIETISQRQAAWQKAAGENAKGRNPSVNSLAYSNGYVYFPVESENIHSLVKYSYSTGETIIFPLVEFVGSFNIQGINIVGEYIYFIAGENVGKGTMLDAPYNIYEMKTDGTGLTMVKSGDYYDLLSTGDTFYALSYSKGIVKMDKYFNNEEVISDKNIIEMQVTDTDVYFTEKQENEYNGNHVVYKYDGESVMEAMSGVLLHAYFFDTYSIFYKDSSKNTREEIFIADLSLENSERLAILSDGSIGDMQNLIGAVGDTVMLNTSGWLRTTTDSASMRQKKYSEITMSNKRMSSYQSSEVAPEYEVINVLYEEGIKLVKFTDGTYSFSSAPGENAMEIPIVLPQYDEELFSKNSDVINGNRPGGEDFFSEEEIVVEKDDFWYYSSPELNITIERVYDESVETAIYIANIRTQQSTGFNIAYYNEGLPPIYSRYIKTDDIAVENKAVFATNGDFAFLSSNPWSGKIIREGRIFDALDTGIKEYDVDKVYDYNVNCDDFLVMYPDGTMAAYEDTDGITYGELLDAGVQNMLSFGPVLVRDGEKTAACTDPSYYISGANPRCAWGMVEPGHYVAIVADGRQAYVNRGMSFYSLSDYFQRLGCSVAYNLDGGQTAAMAFMGRFINTHQNDAKWTNHRAVWEVIYFGTSDLVPYDLENYYEK